MRGDRVLLKRSSLDGDSVEWMRGYMVLLELERLSRWSRLQCVKKGESQVETTATCSRLF